MNDIKETQDEDLVLNIQKNKNSEKSLKILIDRHSALCVSMINNILQSPNYKNLRSELINDKDYNIYQASLKYDPSKGAKFSTYLGNEIKWKCLNAYNKSNKRKQIPVEESLIDYFSFYANEKNEDNDNLFDFIIKKAKSHPDQRVGKIFHLRYVVGKNNSVMPWKNISQDIGMSIQGCINIHNSIIKNIKTNIGNKINE